MAAPELNLETIGDNLATFLSAWEIDPYPSYFALPEIQTCAYIWHGKFFDHQTVTIVSRADLCSDPMVNTLFTGVANNRAMPEDTQPLDLYIDSALNIVQGLAEAIKFLNDIKGLPNGQRLQLLP